MSCKSRGTTRGSLVRRLVKDMKSLCELGGEYKCEQKSKLPKIHTSEESKAWMKDLVHKWLRGGKGSRRAVKAINKTRKELKNITQIGPIGVCLAHHCIPVRIFICHHRCFHIIHIHIILFGSEDQR